MALIFDCDGTLVDTETPYMEAFNRALARCSPEGQEAPVVEAERWGRDLSGRGLERDAEYAIAEFDLGRTTAEEFLRLWKELFAEIAAEPGSIPLLDGFDELYTHARGCGLKVAVASSSDGPGLRMKLTNGVVANSHAITGLDAFDAVVSNDDVTRHKPDPEIYLLAAARLGVQPDECWVVEDTATGAMAGVNAKMKVVAVPNKFTKGTNDFSHATEVVGSMLEVIGILQPASSDD